MNGKIGCVGYNNGETLFAGLLSPLFWILYFPMDSASGKIEFEKDQSVISRNSTAVKHCRVMTPLFYKETIALERQV